MSSPVLIDVIRTRLNRKEKPPYIYDVAVMDVEGIQTTVVTDCKNKCVKSFYTDSKNNICNSRLQMDKSMDKSPQGIAKLDDNKVMVTISVTPDLVYLTAVNTISVYCSVIPLTTSTFAAGGYGYLDILNMQGNLIKCFRTDKGENPFKFSDYMCLTKGGHILVSDWQDNKITCMTSEGQTLWTHSGTVSGKLSFPQGIITTGGGDILVADTNLKKVIQLTESGEYVRDVLTARNGLRDPRGISLGTDGSLSVCNKIKVLTFKLKET